MKERPILFGAPMVRAILAGTKSQSRRILKPLKTAKLPTDAGYHHTGLDEFGYSGLTRNDSFGTSICPLPKSPFGVPGDDLWVRETWCQPTSLDPGPVFYRADYPACVPRHFENVPPADELRWKPSIHMPRAHSRISLGLTTVRVEPLQDISEDDAIAEGIDGPACAQLTTKSPWKGICAPAAVHAYAALWDSIYGEGAWLKNPWVWVVCFERVNDRATGSQS